jgi:hypothetical protein
VGAASEGPWHAAQHRAAAFVLCLAAAAPCLAGEAAHRLSGRVTQSPVCGGPQLEGQGCEAPLAGARLELIDATGAVKASALADDAGRFTMVGRAGSFRLRVVRTGKLPNCPELDVTLPVVGAREVAIACDSGRR